MILFRPDFELVYQYIIHVEKGGDIVMRDKFVKRLIELRMSKDVSARDMSLSIGQNPGYINNIESGNNLPSMEMFFNICEYLGVTPTEFFDFENSNPKRINEVVKDLKKLRSDKFEHLAQLIKDLI